MTCHQSSSDVARIISESKLHTGAEFMARFPDSSMQLSVAESCRRLFVMSLLCWFPPWQAEKQRPFGLKEESAEAKPEPSSEEPVMLRAGDKASPCQSMPVNASPCQSKIQGTLKNH